MRLLYIDVDSLRPDHLGCYGYHRATSPHIDALAADSMRFSNLYVSDAPCLPSRTALFSGRFGIQTGVVGHGGTAADPFVDGESRGFGSRLGRTSWPRALRNAGMHTATISPFAERHSAWHFYAGFSEVHNTGRRGLESAHEIAPLALDWLQREGSKDNWFLHVNLWDPHTPYRAPAEFGDPFANAPLPPWLTEEVRAKHWEGCGPHSAQEAIGYEEVSDEYKRLYPRQPYLIDSMAQVRRMFDGYDTGVLYADTFVGKLLETLRALGIYEDTAIMLSADHGENLGELNIYGDHQTADQHTSCVPGLLKWPGLAQGKATESLHYQFDLAATILELLEVETPAGWHAESFAPSLREGTPKGRDHLILSQGAWSCQRSVRFEEGQRSLLSIRSYHDGHHGFPDDMLFDLRSDPHEENDIAIANPAQVERARRLIDDWIGLRMKDSHCGIDPLWTVLQEGGPTHTRGELANYLLRLRKTGRGHWADILESRHS